MEKQRGPADSKFIYHFLHLNEEDVIDDWILRWWGACACGSEIETRASCEELVFSQGVEGDVEDVVKGVEGSDGT